jgi:hypothetical protein
MEVLVAANSGGWRMRISPQPAQSPDLNVLDLGFFNSIQSLQDQNTPQTEEELIAEVERAYWSSSPVTLNKTFLTLQFILTKEALIHINELPVSLPCDPDTYEHAQQFLVENPRSTPRTVVEDVDIPLITDESDVLFF